MQSILLFMYEYSASTLLCLKTIYNMITIMHYFYYTLEFITTYVGIAITMYKNNLTLHNHTYVTRLATEQ